MARLRKHNTHLPRYMRLNHGAYYFVYQNKWTHLGRDLAGAYIAYSRLIGRPARVGTISEMLLAYLDDCRGRLSESTIEGYTNSYNHLAKAMGHFQPHELERSDVYAYLKDKGNVQANRDKAFLSAAFSFALNIGAYRGPDPSKGEMMRNKEKARDRYISDDELAQMMSSLPPKLALVAEFLFLTGMRQGDLCQLRVENIREDGIYYWNKKGKRWQVVAWSADLRRCVDAMLSLGRQDGREYLIESRPRGRHVNRGVGAYTPRGLRSQWVRHMGNIGIEDARLHDVRGKAGSDVTLPHASQLLGHKSQAVTKKHYRRKPEKTDPTR